MPPRVPRALVRWLAGRDDRAVIVGDLNEGFARRAQTSRVRAIGWYWSQALTSIPAAVGLRWRRAAPLADLGGDFRRALRLLRRQPGFAAAAIVTMALGAGITTGVVSVVEAVLLRPLPYGNGNRVYVIQETNTGRRGRSVSWSDYLDLSGRLHAFSAIAGYSGASRTLTGAGTAERLPAIEVTPAFFDVLGCAGDWARFTPDAVAGAAPVVITVGRRLDAAFGSDPSAVAGRSPKRRTVRSSASCRARSSFRRAPMRCGCRSAVISQQTKPYLTSGRARGVGGRVPRKTIYGRPPGHGTQR